MRSFLNDPLIRTKLEHFEAQMAGRNKNTEDQAKADSPGSYKKKRVYANYPFMWRKWYKISNFGRCVLRLFCWKFVMRKDKFSKSRTPKMQNFPFGPNHGGASGRSYKPVSLNPGSASGYPWRTLLLVKYAMMVSHHRF